MKSSLRILPIILAAGKGTRMRSSLPKVLHPIGGKPMLQHVINACSAMGNQSINIIYGHKGEIVQDTIEQETQSALLSWIVQAEQKGTGHAVDQARSLIDDNDIVIIAYGDVPLIRSETLSILAKTAKESALAVLTTILDNPTGYGRIVRDNKGQVTCIIEEKDATHDIRLIKEVNTGFIAAQGKQLKTWLSKLTTNNAQGEYYLTDCIAMAAEEGGVVKAVVCGDALEVQGVNDRIQQAELERAYQDRMTKALMLQGVTLLDPKRVDIRGDVEVGEDVVIDINVVFKGIVRLGNGVTVDSGCVLDNCTIGDGTHIYPYSIIENATIEEKCLIGPFARLRPNAYIKERAKVGNFVEIKKSTIGVGSKVSHLTYIGDTDMGENVNVGAGTITCNYDGVNKHQTIVGDDVFIGSSSQLVAPVILGNGTTIGAGSTITKNTPDHELSLSRAKQITIKGWVRPSKKNKD